MKLPAIAAALALHRGQHSASVGGQAQVVERGGEVVSSRAEHRPVAVGERLQRFARGYVGGKCGPLRRSDAGTRVTVQQRHELPKIRPPREVHRPRNLFPQLHHVRRRLGVYIGVPGAGAVVRAGGPGLPTEVRGAATLPAGALSFHTYFARAFAMLAQSSRKSR